MEVKVEDCQMDAVPNQFWGGVKIFTEKPHVINRRICGTVNLWISVCEEDFSRERLISSLIETLESDCCDGENCNDSNPVKTNDSPSGKDGRNYDDSNPVKTNDSPSVKDGCNYDDSNPVKTNDSPNGKDGRNYDDSNPVNTNDSPNGKDGWNYADSNPVKTNDSPSVKDGWNYDDSNPVKTDDSPSGKNGRNFNSDDGTSLIRSVLVNHGFRSFSSYTDGKPDENCEMLESNEESNLQTELRRDNHSTPREGKCNIPWEYLTKTSNAVVGILRKVLPKQVDKFVPAYEVILLDREGEKASYLINTKLPQPSIIPKVNYSISLTNTGISLSCFKGGEVDVESGITWVKENVLPKVLKWTTEVSVDGLVDDRGSLKLIDIVEYNRVYQKLKKKYGKPLVEMWPEVTDPLKFVYEDISIASYLLVLWKQERERKGLSSYQSFVDLGCGNGLLVYILSAEGHPGLGVDVKKRKIWDLFPNRVDLKESTIEPSDKNLYPDYDWLIGNHSDELTPWIPVIAAKSGRNSRFFLIPCCAHDFDQRYRRRHAGRSQYSDYLEYVREIGEVCGFEMKRDKLRIPSTKRICLVGDERTDDPGNCEISKRIDAFIKERTVAAVADADAALTRLNDGPNATAHPESSSHETSDTMWTGNFKARESVQPVRNCTQLKRSVRDDIITTLTSALLEKTHLVEVDVGGKEECVKWNRGGSLTISDLAKRLDRPQLAALKKECGGLQTLLRNHRYIFSISNGEVRLQVPQPSGKEVTSTSYIKTKLCWFHTNHVSGCPLPSQVCKFAHGGDDIQTKAKGFS